MKPLKSDPNNDLININDFNSIEITVSMKNLTAKTEIKNSIRYYDNKEQKRKGDEDLSIQFIEILDKGLALEVPGKSCAEGHSIIVNISTKRTSQDVHLEASAKIDTVEHVSKTRDQITVTLVQFEQVEWNAFCKIFANRQEEIEAFFQAVKG